MGKDMDFASIGDRIFVALESYRHGNRSMDYELKMLRQRGTKVAPLLDELGRELMCLMYHLDRLDPAEELKQVINLLRLGRECPSKKAS